MFVKKCFSLGIKDKIIIFAVFLMSVFVLQNVIFASQTMAAGKKANGSVCTSDAECASGNCVEVGAAFSVKNCQAASAAALPKVSIPTGATAKTSTPVSSGGVVKFSNPLEFTTVEGLLGNIMSAIQKIVVVLSLVVIVIGAVMYIISTGESETVERGKKAITMALVGLAIAIAAPSILKELAGILGWGDVPSNVGTAMSLSEIAVRVLNFLLGITGVLSIIMMVVGAIMYLTSTGDEGRIDQGKQIFKYSVLGVVIALASMVIVRQIAAFFTAG